MAQHNFNLAFTRARAFKIGATIVLLGTLLDLALSRDFYDESMTSAYLSLALASALIVLVMIRRAWFDFLWVSAGGFFLAALDYRVMHFTPRFMAGFSFVGLSALAVLGARTVWTQGEDRKLLLYGFLPSVLFVASEWMASTLLDITEALHPKTFDLFCIPLTRVCMCSSASSWGKFFGRGPGCGSHASSFTSLCRCHWLWSTPHSCAQEGKMHCR